MPSAKKEGGDKPDYSLAKTLIQIETLKPNKKAPKQPVKSPGSISLWPLTPDQALGAALRVKVIKNKPLNNNPHGKRKN